MGDKFDRLYY